jgi:hypothetical protein
VSLKKYTPDLTELVSIITHAPQEFVSSSLGITGTLSVLGQTSDVIRSLESLSESLTTFSEDSPIADDPMARASDTVKRNVRQGIEQSDVHGLVSGYMAAIGGIPEDPKNLLNVNIERVSPTPYFSTISNLKGYIINNLMDYYRVDFNGCNNAYVNYNTLNFFTSSNLPTDSVFLYPNFTASYDSMSAPYTPSGPFSIDFWINPRYTNDVDYDTGGPVAKDFKAGTILHLSSTLAVSLVTGSSVDSCNRSDGYRILLQLSHSADISPSKIGTSQINNERTFPQDLVFLSGDNTLRRNRWHHVTIRWGGNNINYGTGSIQIDDTDISFVAPSASISSQAASSVTSNEPDALCVGNFYEGRNSGPDSQSAFFNSTSARKYGTIEAPGYSADPASYGFNHPLNAEIHDLKMYHEYVDDRTVYSSSLVGPDSLEGLVFYVPPFFTKESPKRDVLVTTNATIYTGTYTPFNNYVAFGPFGHLINLENFSREFVREKWPRLLNLEADPNSSATGSSMSEILYATGSIVKRNLSILPCDNGRFIPNFNLLSSGTESHLASSSPLSFFTDDEGGLDIGIISLNEMVPPDGKLDIHVDGGFMEKCSGPYPENITKEWNNRYFSIYQRLKDASSNQITIFNIPSLFFSQEIRPRSFSVYEQSLSGSGGKISINLKDDGRGSLYRADSETIHAEWNNVGNIFYKEGLVLIKSPHLCFFGKDFFKMNFEGTHGVHVLTLNCFANSNQFNSSSNPGYTLLSASFEANDTDSGFVYIDEVNIHDDNLNVIMRGTLAQPVVKRFKDELLFKLKMDF